MTYGQGALIVAACCVIAATMGFAAFRLTHVDLRRNHHEVGGMIFLQVGVVYGVVLAFVFAQVFEEITVASDAVNAERGDLHAIAALASALPPSSAHALREAIVGYVDAVISDEWPAMDENREESPVARGRFNRMLLVASGIDVAGGEAAAARDHIMDLLLDAQARRATRIHESGNGVPQLIWILLIGSAVLLQLFVVFSGTEYMYSHVMFSTTFSLLVSSILVVIALMNYPFSGSMRLSSSEFAATLARVNQSFHDAGPSAELN